MMRKNMFVINPVLATLCEESALTDG
jgi:hypothetical protein